MNEAHLHMVVNHFPIIGMIVGFVILVSGLLFKSRVTKRIGTITLLLTSLFVFPSFESGEGAEEIVEHLPGVSENLIEKHEELAEQFMLFVWVLLPLILLSFYADWKQKAFLQYVHFLIAIVSFVALIFAKQVGTTGGEIRHTEIRKDTTHISPKDVKDLNEEDEDIED